MEERRKVIYPIQTLSQLPLILKAFRKEKALTQAAMAERLGITQQSYAYFEANPAAASVERLFLVLRMLGVEISLDYLLSVTPSSPMKSKVKALAVGKVGSVSSPIKTPESW